MTPELSVVIPARGRWDLTSECLRRLREHTPEGLEVLVVDGGSSATVLRALSSHARRWPALRVILLGRSLSFAAAVNAGLREARGRVLVLLNNDAWVTPGWSAALLRALAEPGVGAAGPVVTVEADSRSAAAWALGRAGKLRGAKRLYAHCLALRRDAFEATGLLDERLVWGEEDDDYSFRLRLGGWRLVVAEDALVVHRGGATRGRWPKARLRAQRRANAAVLREKWLAEAGRIRRELSEVLS